MVAAHDSKSCPARGESSSLSSGTARAQRKLCRRARRLRALRERLEARSDVFVCAKRKAKTARAGWAKIPSGILRLAEFPPAQKT